jgi:predicted lipoprotein with Yx(FWY)xxD motif
MRLAILALCVLAAGCGTSDDTSSSRPSDSASDTGTTRTPVPATGTTVITADSEYGTMLYDASGQPIYLFDAESDSEPRCYGECADEWPPVLTSGAPRATEDVRSSLLGTTRRDDGTTQVTYAGHPLYFYAHEGKYQVLCHNVDEFGGTWLVVRPDGTPAPG